MDGFKHSTRGGFLKVRIFYHHTDTSGVVYYAQYLAFLEEARTEFLESKGVRIPELKSQGIFFVVGRQEIDYESPAFYGDVLEVRSWTGSASAVRLNFEGEIKNQHGRLIAKARTVLVCVDESLKPKAMPEDFRARMAV